MEEKEKIRKEIRISEAEIERGVPSAPTLDDFLDTPESSPLDTVPETDVKSEDSVERAEVSLDRTDVRGLLSEPVIVNSSSIQRDKIVDNVISEDQMNCDTQEKETEEDSDTQVKSTDNPDQRTETESFAELNKNLNRMEPHFFLNKELEAMHLEASAPDIPLEADSVPGAIPSAPFSTDFPQQIAPPSAPIYPSLSGDSGLVDGGVPSAPSAPLLGGDDVVHQDAFYELQEDDEIKENSGEGYVEEEEEFEDDRIDMLPFTDSQLHTLYHNVELEKNYEFVNHWLETQKIIERLELDELLTNYQRVRSNLISTKKQLDRIQENIDSLQTGLWIITKEKVEEEGECEDGAMVMASRDRTIAEFSPETSKSLRMQFKQARELLGENLSLFNFRAELCRLKVEEFIHGVLERSLKKEEVGGVFTPQEELRLTVSVLFKYLRKDLQDEKLGRDLRIWLDRTIGVVLNESTLYDHLFILNHLMRCPSGVGKWGASYVQPAIPTIDPEETNFDNPFLDHMITILATVLLPVKERSNFLQEFKLKAKNLKQVYSAEECERDSIWTVLDGEGSEDEDPEETWSELREADLIALLNQIPVDHMFRYVLRIEERDGKDVYDVSKSTEHSILKLYAFSTQFVYLLREGLKTFNTPRYRQFAKRLGRLIRQTVHFVSDHWENFKAQNQHQLRSPMFQRLQLEYDCFFLRATKCIFSSLKLGIWQYLALIPYGTISSEMLWRIFYILHLDYHEESHSDFGADISDWAEALSGPDLRIQFEEKCAEAEETERYFLLSAFANMALSRHKKEEVFIKRVVMDLFYIGFVAETTRETSCKNCRDLLSSVCAHHPFILSYIIQLLKVKITDIGKLGSYLAQELPWHIFQPEEDDLSVLFSWLHLSISRIENVTARIILGNMNWNFGFLPVRHHVSTAVTVVEVFCKYTQEIVNQGIVNSSVATMSNLAMATLSNQGSQDQQFTKWCWEIISRLRLHMLDRTLREYDDLLAGKSEVFKQLLNFDLSPEIENLVASAVARHPMACYCAVLLTQVGHSPAEILERGLGLVKVILDDGRFDHVMELMMHILPIFLMDLTALDSQELINIMSRLVNADQTYISLAKTLITGTFPGPVTKELGNMMHKLISRFDSLGQYSRKDIISLLVNLLILIPSWNSNSSVLYLLDIICSYAFGHSVCHWSVLQFFENMHTENNKQGGNSGLLSLITRLGSQGHQLLINYSGSSQFCWLSFFVLQAEENYLKKTGLWRTLVSELSKTSQLEEALTEAGKLSEVHPPASGQLIIYRWAQQAMDTPHDHPIAFAFWQRFLALYLSRPSELVDGQEANGIGNKFFTGIFNSMYLGKIKTSLKTNIEQFEKVLHAHDAPKTSHCEDMCKLLRTCYLWIDEDKLLDGSLYVPALTPVYDPDRLVKTLSGETTLWTEYCDQDRVSAARSEATTDWDQLHFRHFAKVEKSKSTSSLIDRSAEERIVERLHSFESRLPAPPVRRLAKPIPTIPNLSCKEALTHTLIGPLQTLKDLSESHCNNISAYGSLNCSYLEIVSTLWKDEEVSMHVSAACPGMQVGKEKVACSGPALVNLTFLEAKKQEGVAVKLDMNRKEHTELENQLLAPMAPKFVVAAALVNNIIQKILKLFEKDLGKGVESIHLPLASHLFCCLAKATTENWLVVPPLRHFVSECLENLANVVVSQGACSAEVILDILKESPHLSSMLTPHFFPQDHELLVIYQKIGELPVGDGSLPFVLLSKLDIVKWLNSDPSNRDVLRLIGLMFRSLEITGIKPDPERLMIHGLHRKHVMQMLAANFPVNYQEVLSRILVLCGSNQIDPEILFDVLNTFLGTGTVLVTSDPEQVIAAISSFVESAGSHDYSTVLTIISHVASHFDKDRLNFGLYGLYPKYRSYLKPLSYLFSLLSMQMIHGQLEKGKGALSSEAIDFLWRNLKTIYDPWIRPINPESIQSTATWIQQLSDKSSSLMPWIPGDSTLAKLILESFITSVKLIMEHEQCSTVLSYVLALYTNYFAQVETKDHIFGVVHPAFSSLTWSTFYPSMKDIEAMMKIISMFLPQCHAFLGTLFVQIDWQAFVLGQEENTETLKRILPAVFCLMIKLSSEPSVRQGGRLLSLVTQSESWNWCFIEYPHYEALAQWYVMSVDCRCIVKHKERNPLDAAIIRLFIAAAEFSSESKDQNTEKKQMMWVKCCAKLLTSVCGKQKNFLSTNQPALHTTIRKLLEEMNMACTAKSSNIMIKDFLTIFNTPSSSVLPGSALVVTQSWFTQAESSSLLIPAFLACVGHTVRTAKLASSLLESALEAYFRDDEAKPSWDAVKLVIQWPSGSKIKELLEESIPAGNVLVLYAYIDLKQGESVNCVEEQVLASTLLEYIRQLQTVSVSGLESKLPLLYKKLVLMLHRQVEYSKDPAWAVRTLCQFSDILILVAEASPSWGRNILGAIGLGSSNGTSLRGKFLARSLAVFIRSLINPEKTGLIEKLIELSEEGSLKAATLNSPEMKNQLEKLRDFKSNKGFSGFHDLLSWVLEQVEVETNRLKDATLFIDYLVIDKLYTELYLRT